MPAAKKNLPAVCAGCYTAHAAIEMYAEVFEDEGALEQLEGFASHYGPDFYRLPRNTDTITLVQEPNLVSGTLSLGTDTLVPLRAGETLRWRIAS